MTRQKAYKELIADLKRGVSCDKCYDAFYYKVDQIIKSEQRQAIYNKNGSQKVPLNSDTE